MTERVTDSCNSPKTEARASNEPGTLVQAADVAFSGTKLRALTRSYAAFPEALILLLAAAFRRFSQTRRLGCLFDKRCRRQDRVVALLQGTHVSRRQKRAATEAALSHKTQYGEED